MSDLDRALNVRTSRDFLRRVDDAALEMGMNRSEWVIKILADALRTSPRPQPLTVQRSRMLVGYKSASLCNHPLSVRTEKSPNGESRCLACDTTIYPLR